MPRVSTSQRHASLQKYILSSIIQLSVGTDDGAASSRAWNHLIRLVLVPVGQDVANPRRVGESVDVLEVLFRELERLGGHVGNVLPNQLAGIDAGLVDLLQQERPEWLDARPQERAVEWHIDALEWDGGEAALKFDWLRFGLSLLRTLLDDLHKVLLDVLETHGLHELLDVNLLSLEVVRDIGEGVEGAKVAGTDILHVLHVQVDNLEQPSGSLCDVLADVLQCLLVESLADTRRVDSAHGVVRAASLVALDSDLHRETTVEHHRDQRLDWHDLGERSKCAVFSERMASKAAVLLDKALVEHVRERSFLHQRQGRLGELSCREQARGRSVCVRAGVLGDFLEDFLRLDGAVCADCLESHRHVVLANGLAPWATKVDGELLRVVLDNIGDRKACQEY